MFEFEQEVPYLGEWLAERQCPSGGLCGKFVTALFSTIIESGICNLGRPEKLPDLCYSWWIIIFVITLSNINSGSYLVSRTFFWSGTRDKTGFRVRK